MDKNLKPTLQWEAIRQLVYHCFIQEVLPESLTPGTWSRLREPWRYAYVKVFMETHTLRGPTTECVAHWRLSPPPATRGYGMPYWLRTPGRVCKNSPVPW
ncbi:hypothetical protein NKDENANG_03947 [Candidatus Entotheonellaceae bacterium PAL068K]